MRVRPSGRMVCTIVSSAWLLVTLLACGHGYRSGTLSSNQATGNEVGDGDTLASCLEMRVSRHDDERLRELGWIGIEYEMGNACDGAVPVDLRNALVIATPVGGLRPIDEPANLPHPVYYHSNVGDTPVVLSAWDPQEEIRGAMLDGRRHAREVIAYVVPLGLTDLDVCVEVSGVVDAEVEPVCFRWRAS